MNLAAGIPSRWILTLHSGSVIELAADAYAEVDRHLVFNVLVDATQEDQSRMFVDWHTPKQSTRVGIVVAKIPAGEVADIFTAPSWIDDGSGSGSPSEPGD